MKENTNIQPTGITNIRKSNLRTRIALTLAGGGVAGALLVGGLFGFHSNQALSITRPNTAGVSSFMPVSNFSSSIKTVAVSDRVSNYTTYRDIAYQAAVHAGINPSYFLNQIQQESGFNPWAVSPAGAEGIAQFMPATAASLGVNPWNPTSALYGAANLMASLSAQFGGNYAKALAAYNAGPGAVQNAVYSGGSNWYYYLPTETRNYVAIILGW